MQHAGNDPRSEADLLAVKAYGARQAALWFVAAGVVALLGVATYLVTRTAGTLIFAVPAAACAGVAARLRAGVRRIESALGGEGVI